MNTKLLGDFIREGDWLHTGDILVRFYTTKTGKPRHRIVIIERIVYNPDLTRSFVLRPWDFMDSKLYRTLTSEATLRRKYRRLHTNEERVDYEHQAA